MEINLYSGENRISLTFIFCSNLTKIEVKQLLNLLYFLLYSTTTKKFINWYA